MDHYPVFLIRASDPIDYIDLIQRRFIIEGNNALRMVRIDKDVDQEELLNRINVDTSQNIPCIMFSYDLTQHLSADRRPYVHQFQGSYAELIIDMEMYSVLMNLRFSGGTLILKSLKYYLDYQWNECEGIFIIPTSWDRNIVCALHKM